MSGEPTERADAAANRRSIIAAARALLSASAPGTVTVEAIAAEAGVGKGTVFRRFGDYAGLLDALIAAPVAELRQKVERGDPPLGPGGTPDEALLAYVDALFEFVCVNRNLLRALEQRVPHAYYNNEASQFWIRELRQRIAAARPTVDANHLAYTVFTSMRADVLEYLTEHERMSRERIRAGIHALVGAPA